MNSLASTLSPKTLLEVCPFVSLEEAYYLKELSLKLDADFKLDTLEQGDLYVLLGGFLSAYLNRNESMLLEHIHTHKIPYALLRPLQDSRDTNKACFFLPYEINTEVALLALLVRGVLERKDCLKGHILENLDVGYLSSESNMSEEELEELLDLMFNAKKVVLVLGNEITKHMHAQFLYTLCYELQTHAHMNILQAPPASSLYSQSDLTPLKYNSINKELLKELALKEKITPYKPQLMAQDLNILDQILEANGSFAYLAYNTAKNPKLYFSKQFKMANKINYSKAQLQILDKTIECELKECPYLKGLVAILEGAFFETYPYAPITNLSHSQGIS
ncbi:hypothetical protein [Helicobacter cetorum]|uniref:hypothetical protein n=1 Tax=Helicobacter cetorum TaxID=138563 RepID=UPI000CF14F7A|nr:hypothetical protein [Helicobacter cetorum]